MSKQEACMADDDCWDMQDTCHKEKQAQGNMGRCVNPCNITQCDQGKRCFVVGRKGVCKF